MDDLVNRLRDRAKFNIPVAPEKLMVEAAAEISRLRMERDRLVEGLRPFAKFAGRFGDTARDNSWQITSNPTGRGNLTMGDVRTAAALVAEAEGKEL
jgi:hypothetical protein